MQITLVQPRSSSAVNVARRMRHCAACTAGHFPWIFNAAERPRMMIVVLTLLLILELVQGERGIYNAVTCRFRHVEES